MSLPLRVGVWFQENHTPYGGPGLVLSGTVLGLYQYAAQSGIEIIVLLNELGDVNWAFGLTASAASDAAKMPALWTGPACFNRADAVAAHESSEVWRAVRNALFPSTWFAEFVNHGLPYAKGIEGRHQAVWPAGVDTDFFTPSAAEKTQDYFIYFKSQNFADLKKIQTYLFSNWFGIRGTVLTYYNYDPDMLRDAARRSKFCIMLGGTETQGLAALEIMACDCPLFVLDTAVCKSGDFEYTGATSVTNMDRHCGSKSCLAAIETDFPQFISDLASYSPRLFVTQDFSYTAAARRLLDILITGIEHKSEHKQEENTGVDKEAEDRRAAGNTCHIANEPAK